MEEETITISKIRFQYLESRIQILEEERNKYYNENLELKQKIDILEWSNRGLQENITAYKTNLDNIRKTWTHLNDLLLP